MSLALLDLEPPSQLTTRLGLMRSALTSVLSHLFAKEGTELIAHRRPSQGLDVERCL